MGHIHWEYPLLPNLLYRWNARTSTFHILIGEMMIIIKDIHRLYHLPIHDQWIQHVVDHVGAFPMIAYLYGVDQVDIVSSEITYGGI